MKKLSYLLLLFFLYGCGWFDIKLDSDFEAPVRYLDYMPDKTTIGANTFGCYEDGKLVAIQDTKQEEGIASPMSWRPRHVSAFLAKFKAESFFQIALNLQNDGILFLTCTNIKNGINRCDVVHNHSLDRSDNYYETLDSIDIYITYLDEVEHIACGEFSKAILHSQKNKEETITLTDGRFDVKYGIGIY